MKKLLSLLSVITISGTAVPTTIASSPYQKEENLNGDINYQQKNNLENLKREKRQDRNRTRIFQLTEKLIINKNNIEEYRNSFQIIINEMVNIGVLRRVEDLNILINPDFRYQDNTILSLNPEVNYGYFRLPIIIREEQNEQSFQRNFELVIRTDNLYVEGFINNNNYYHFNFNNININMQPQAVRDGSVPHLIQIQGMNNIQLNIGPDYRDMIQINNNNIFWNDVFNSFNTLTSNINVSTEQSLGNLATALGRVILFTAESIRFWSIHTIIIQNFYYNNNGYIILGRNRNNDIYNLLVSWSDESRIQSLAADIISTPHNRRIIPATVQEGINILNNYGYLRNTDNEWIKNLFAILLNLPINQLINIIGNSNVRVLLGYFIKPNLNNCNRRRSRELNNNNFWHEKFCDSELEINKIKGEITTVKIIDEKIIETKNKLNLKNGSVYFGTNEGVYLIHGEGKVNKISNLISNLNYSIKEIILDKKNEIYFLTNNGELVYLQIGTDINNNIISHSYSPINIYNSDWEKIKILSIKKIIKNSDDNYLKIGDIYAWTNDGGYLIRNQGNPEKIVNNKHYLINHNDDSITEVHFNREDNSYCHSTGKKIAAVSTATAIGASAGSIIPWLGTLIGAGIGALVGGVGSVFITEEVCNHR